MKKDKYLLTLDNDFFDLIVYSLINMKNTLMEEGRYTDAVYDALITILSAKKKYI